MSRSLFIVGAGRNGTSMTAGLFRNCGLYMGENLHAPSIENPRGYFESPKINTLNNQILGAYNPARETISGLGYRHDSPGTGSGWLSRIPLETRLHASPEQQAEITKITTRTPFCLKDTRFCYLLHLWRMNVPDSRMICVFRPPSVSVTSVLKSCRTRPYLYDMAISVNQAFELWTLMYSHILQHQSQHGEWFFVNYEDILNQSALPALEEFTGYTPDAQFPDRIYNRTQPEYEVPSAASDVFEALKNQAEISRSRFSA